MIVDDLRAGSGDPLFVVTGAGGSAEEFAPVARRLRGDHPIVVLAPDASATATVEALAAETVAVIRTRQSHAPYRLLGYSMGGIVALEAAQQLAEAGAAVAFLGAVDAFYDRRYWPTRLVLRAIARRSALHSRALLGKPPAHAWREVRTRLAALGRQVHRRMRPGKLDEGIPETLPAANILAMARWRPRRFTTDVVLFNAADDDFGLDLADLWRPWLARMRVRRIPGGHLDLMREPESVARLAAAIDEAFSASPPLRTLVAATFRWPEAARLAVDLHATGHAVHAVAPRGSALHDLAAVERSHRLRVVNAIGSLRRAIESSEADLIIPFDDRTRRALHRIHAEADPATEPGARLRRLIERSLGPAEHYASIYSRVATMRLAAEAGIRCPPTAPVRSADDVSRWLTRHGPAVLKTDGSWGGRGTRVIRSEADVARAWRRLHRPASAARCLKRLVLERDPWPLRDRITGSRPVVSIQSYVDGVPANAAVACLDGELVGAVPAVVVRSQGATEASTVLRLVEHPEMLAAVTAMVRRLRLSGLVGFDFMVERDTGRAHLIEINPRATPTSHLVSAGGGDLLTALRAALGRPGPPPRPPSAHSGGCVALFPQELQRDPTGAMLAGAHHDVPWHAPDLVEHNLRDLRCPGSVAIRDGLAERAAVPAVAPGGDSPPVAPTATAAPAAPPSGS